MRIIFNELAADMYRVRLPSFNMSVCSKMDNPILLEESDQEQSLLRSSESELLNQNS